MIFSACFISNLDACVTNVFKSLLDVSSDAGLYKSFYDSVGLYDCIFLCFRVYGVQFCILLVLLLNVTAYIYLIIFYLFIFYFSVLFLLFYRLLHLLRINVFVAIN